MPSVSMHRAWRHLDSASSVAARGLSMPCEEGVIDEPNWPRPFWSGQRSRPLRWKQSGEGQGALDFEVALVEPDRRSTVKLTNGYPLVFFYAGIASPGGLQELDLAKLAHLTPCAFVVVAPRRPQGHWWFLDNDREWGWIDGNFQPAMADLYVAWMHQLAAQPGIDKHWVSAFGFSAGAYGLTELLSRSGRLFRSIALGGVHGHAQPDMEGIVGKRAQKPATILNKWSMYLVRIGQHGGVPGGIHCMHNEEDTLCPWAYAAEIVNVLSARQKMFGYSEVTVEQVGHVRRDKNKSDAHGYFNQAFMRKEVLQRLLPGGQQPRAGAVFDAAQPEAKRARIEPAVSSSAPAVSTRVPQAIAMSYIDRAKPVERSGLMCANETCSYMVHKSPAMGGFCCKNCHYAYETVNSSKKSHGAHCQKVVGQGPRALPLPPGDPLR